jgi:hypothetical protein
MQKPLLALVVFVVFSFPTAQAVNAKSGSHDLSATVKAFENHVKDFRAMQQAAQGEQLAVLTDLEHVAAIAEERAYAANSELQMYDSISCDRAKARAILKEQLEYYVWVFNIEVTRTTSELTFVKAPAAAQIGLKMKDDLQAAKEKFDEILAGLQ